MGLVAGHDAHPAERGDERALVAGGGFVVLPGDDLLVVRVRTLDQAGVDLGGLRPEAEVVFAPGDLQFLFRAEEPPDLLQCLGRHDEVGLALPASGPDRDVHPGQPVSVGGDHPHPVGPQLPEHAVENRPALLGGGGKGDMPDELLEVRGRTGPATVELDGRKGGEFLAGQPEQPELGPAALDVDPLLAGGGEPDRGVGQFPHDFHELLRGEGNGTFLVDRRRNTGGHADIQIGTREPEAVLGDLQQDVGQDRQGRLVRDAPLNGQQAFLKLLTCDRELHALPTQRFWRITNNYF